MSRVSRRLKVTAASFALLVIAATAALAVFGPRRALFLLRVSRSDILLCEAARERACAVFEPGAKGADTLRALVEVIPADRLAGFSIRRLAGERVEGKLELRRFVVVEREAVVEWDATTRLVLARVSVPTVTELALAEGDALAFATGPLAALVDHIREPSPRSPFVERRVLLKAVPENTRLLLYNWSSSTDEVGIYLTE
jgi:hypothetical protein